jgi:outer membrane protein
MKKVLDIPSRILSLILLLVLCCSCVRAMRPDKAMSSPEISQETKVKELLRHIDRDLAGSTVVAPAVTAKPGGTITLTLQDAVLTGLEHNENFQVERLKPAISRTAEEVERAAFDPVLSASVVRSRGQDVADSSLRVLSLARNTDAVDSTKSGVGLRQATPLGGSVELHAEENRQSLHDGPDTSSTQRNWDLTITQSLLKGRGPDVTLARLRQSRLDTEISLYELQGSAEALAAQIERGYWAFVLASRSLEIYQQSLAIAKQQVAEVGERIKVGELAESEGAAAEAEAALRYQQLVAAQGAAAKARLNLLRLVNPGQQIDWQAELKLTDHPEVPSMDLDSVDSHVALGLSKRPDLNQARLQVRRRDLEVTQTKNGLLPKLDLFVSLGGSRFADSFVGQDDQLDNQKAYAGGLTLQMPLGNREASARQSAAGFSLNQATAALANMEQLVQVDVRSAYVDVEQALAQVKAAKATVALRQKTLTLEQEKFRLGRSTTLLVAQAQRDLVASQISQAEAVVGVRIACLNLYRMEGSLLVHRGIWP